MLKGIRRGQTALITPLLLALSIALIMATGNDGRLATRLDPHRSLPLATDIPWPAGQNRSVSLATDIPWPA